MEQFFKEGKKSPYYKTIKQALSKIDKEIISIVKTESPLLSESAIHLYKSGGKRLRPMLILLGGHFGNYDEKKLIPLATAMEVVHMATLIHDDVVDEAILRRQKPTVKAIWGNSVSVYTGNYLLSKAMAMVATYEDETLNQTFSHIAIEMCHGEISQMDYAYTLNTDRKVYFHHIKQKTALLLSASCGLGAYLCQGDKEVVSALKTFGTCLGMAFQITDDILDYSPSGKKFGKTLGGDLHQGIATLPILHAFENSDNQDKLKELFLLKNKSENDIHTIIELITNCGSIEYAKEKAKEYMKKGMDALSNLPNSPAKETLFNLAYFAMERKY